MIVSKPQIAGFTIIEVMLFLAISGALAVGILASSSIAINSQRYRDATNSLQATLQQQYNETAHVVNDRAGTAESCDANGVTVRDSGSGTTEPRGASDCLVMGRYVAIEASGAITLANILGYEARSAIATSDTQALKNYDFFIDSSSTEKNEVAWSGEVTFRDNANENIEPSSGGALSLFILRSPLTGVTRTYVQVAPVISSTIDDAFLTDSAAQRAYKICVTPSLFSVGTHLGILIRERAASAGAIELLTEDSAC